MAIDRDKKKKIIGDFGMNSRDTGSSSVQIAVLTSRINELIQHFKKNKKDFGSRRGLLKMVGRRRKMLGYLKKNNPNLYKDLLAKLNLRK